MLRQHNGATVDLSQPATKVGRRSRSGSGQPSCLRSLICCRTAFFTLCGRMVAFAKRLAKDKLASRPSGYDKDFDICRRFLDQHAWR